MLWRLFLTRTRTQKRQEQPGSRGNSQPSARPPPGRRAAALRPPPSRAAARPLPRSPSPLRRHRGKAPRGPSCCGRRTARSPAPPRPAEKPRSARAPPSDEATHLRAAWGAVERGGAGAPPAFPFARRRLPPRPAADSALGGGWARAASSRAAPAEQAAVSPGRRPRHGGRRPLSLGTGPSHRRGRESERAGGRASRRAAPEFDGRPKGVSSIEVFFWNERKWDILCHEEVARKSPGTQAGHRLAHRLVG